MTRPSLRFTRALTAALLLALTGCDTGSGDHTLVLWHAWGGRELDTLKGLITRFEARYPGVEVLPLQVPYDKLRDKFIRSAAANGGPDVVIGDADWSARFAASDLATPVDELFTAAELQRFAPGTLDALRYDGRLYALPESRETVALYYNKDLVATPPGNVEDWFREASIVSANGKGTGFVLKADFYFNMGYYFGAGGRLFGQDGRVDVASPAGRDLLSLVSRFARSPGVIVSPEYAKPDAMFKARSAAMIVNGPWALVDYQAALGDALGVATLPRLADGRPAASWVGVKCLMFNRNSDPAHRKLAHDFGAFVTEPESQAQLAQQAGHIPAVTGYTAREGSPLATFAAQADVGTPVSIRPEVAAIWEPMDRAVRKVVQGEAEAPAALEEANVTIQARIDAMRKPRP
ncbi:MAG: extracellular solute-binding protein [Candidatus Sericytochromatia bacterium]|nr:extracellular solute-binding protein [Candidatus Sericytochromatia bacterium]